MRYVVLLLDALEQVREWARGKHGHVRAVMVGLVVVNGRVLDMIGRIGGVRPDGGIGARIMIARSVAIQQRCVGQLGGIFPEPAQPEYWIAPRCDSVYGECAVGVGVGVGVKRVVISIVFISRTRLDVRKEDEEES